MVRRVLLSLLAVVAATATLSPAPAAAFAQDVTAIRRVFNLVDPATCGCKPRTAAAGAGACQVRVGHHAEAVGLTCRHLPGTEFCCDRRKPGQVVDSLENYAARYLSGRRQPGSLRPRPRPRPALMPSPSSPPPQAAQKLPEMVEKDVQEAEGRTPKSKLTLSEAVREAVAASEDDFKVVTAKEYYYGTPAGAEEAAEEEVRSSGFDVNLQKKRIEEGHRTTERMDIVDEESPCECADASECPEERRDLTFGRSCGYGRVRCCREVEEELEILLKEEEGGEVAKPGLIPRVRLPFALVEEEEFQDRSSEVESEEEDLTIQQQQQVQQQVQPVGEKQPQQQHPQPQQQPQDQRHPQPQQQHPQPQQQPQELQHPQPQQQHPQPQQQQPQQQQRRPDPVFGRRPPPSEDELLRRRHHLRRAAAVAAAAARRRHHLNRSFLGRMTLAVEDAQQGIRNMLGWQ